MKRISVWLILFFSSSSFLFLGKFRTNNEYRQKNSAQIFDKRKVFSLRSIAYGLNRKLVLLVLSMHLSITQRFHSVLNCLAFHSFISAKSCRLEDERSRCMRTKHKALNNCTLKRFGWTTTADQLQCIFNGFFRQTENVFPKCFFLFLALFVCELCCVCCLI